MGFPEQERFTAEDVARRWEKSPAYIDELIRTLQFTHIIVVGELIGDSPLTRHLYFDRALWIEDYGKKLQRDPAIRLKELEESIEHHTKYQEKLGLTFDPSTLRRTHAEDIGPTYCYIGQDEIANFWNPSPPRNEWKQPKEPVQVYIPLLAVEAFEKKHSLNGQANLEQRKAPERRSASVRPLEDGNTTSQGLPWVKEARAIAIPLAKKHKNLNTKQIAEKTHEVMVKLGEQRDSSVRGRGDRIPSAETIRRHALKGIKN